MSTAIANETYQSLQAELKTDILDNPAFELLAKADSRYMRDLKINVQNSLNSTQLTKKESLLIALSVSVNEKNAKLEQIFSTLAMEQGATEAELAEVYACTSLLSINNVFYRFRHYVGKDYYSQQPAGIKMTVMGNSVLGKEFFELLSLCVSAVNGCEACVKSHEASILNHGASEARVYDAIRAAAMIKGFCTLV